MRQDFEWHGARSARRVRDWDDRPLPDPVARQPWRYLPLVAAIALVGGYAIATGIERLDRRDFDRLLGATGLAAPVRAAADRRVGAR